MGDLASAISLAKRLLIPLLVYGNVMSETYQGIRTEFLYFHVDDEKHEQVRYSNFNNSFIL